MSDSLENPASPFVPSFADLGNRGEPVPEVDPDDLKNFLREIRGLEATGQNYAIGFEHMKAICRPGANAYAVWYRSSMIWMLNKYAQEQLAPWVRDEEVSDVVFRTMAAIPMEWVGHTVREGWPFDVEEFFRRLREGRC